MESFVFGILIEHCVAVAFLTSGRFREGFASKSAFITCLPMRAKCLVHLNLIFLVPLKYLDEMSSHAVNFCLFYKCVCVCEFQSEHNNSFGIYNVYYL